MKVFIAIFITLAICSGPLFTFAEEAPENEVPGSQAIKEDMPLTFKNKVTVKDADGDLASVKLKVGKGEIKVKVPNSDPPTIEGNNSGIVTLTGNEAQINRALMEFSYTGNQDYHGEDVLTVESTDGKPTTSSATVRITVTAVPDDPINDVPKIKSVLEDTPLTFNDVKVSDGDSDLKSVKLSVNKGKLEIITPKEELPKTKIIPNDKSSTVTIQWEQDLKVKESELNFIYRTNEANYTGTDTLAVLSTDHKGASAKAEVPIHVTSASDTTCDWSRSGKEFHGGDLNKNLSVGTVATYSIVRYNLADKKASFNAKSAGFGLSFRYYTDNNLATFGGLGPRGEATHQFLNKRLATDEELKKQKDKVNLLESIGETISYSPIVSDLPIDTANNTSIAEIPAGCRANSADLLNTTDKISARYSFAPVIYLSQDEDEDELTVQLGLNLGFFNDLFTLGVGWNLSGDNAGEWFILAGPSFGFQF